MADERLLKAAKRGDTAGIVAALGAGATLECKGKVRLYLPARLCSPFATAAGWVDGAHARCFVGPHGNAGYAPHQGGGQGSEE